METRPEHIYECIVVGGGIAGLQAAIQLGRYQHDILVIDGNRGRSTLCRNYHNLLGWPDGVSGLELRRLGRSQALHYGVQFRSDVAVNANRLGFARFSLDTATGERLFTETLLFATGITDAVPAIPGLVPALGDTVFICPDCDGYEAIDRKTTVLGSGDAGAAMALELLYFTKHLVFVNHHAEAVADSLQKALANANIPRIDGDILQVEAGVSGPVRVTLSDGRSLETERCFLAFGGNQVESELASSLGAQCETKHHLAVHPRTKQTTMPNLFAAGDVVAHSEQVSIAMGDGAGAAIFIHKALLGEHVDVCQMPSPNQVTRTSPAHARPGRLATEP
ncbi:NAD(P)/FAD-dependent oxidoreductase [Alicyclobacillus sp. ALC3]|uniref:NAD(P)/FAD-dependent oxidoreductase n=1 Tax=Alicyclobacillus sp. ALC3 TaxID=2796143 RepID=UPI002379F5BE|nr:NAD(P)/FAD-dependent oxidoreductase [Alicyclobacillus sp. ALC3]WDL98290.1 NAD(P)/FAD-dependent oxidoreductase [Alicyclobacillus sp. ALC3]